MKNIGPCLHLLMKKRTREMGLGLARAQEQLKEEGVEMQNLHSISECQECGKSFRVSYNLPDPTPTIEELH